MNPPNWNTGIAAVHARDTAHDTPSQRRVPGRFTRLDQITSVVGSIDPALDNPSIYGGDIPDHSIHWRNYFSGGWRGFPLKTATDIPNPANVLVAVAEPQNLVTTSGHNPWDWFRRLVQGSMRNGMESGSATK